MRNSKGPGFRVIIVLVSFYNKILLLPIKKNFQPLYIMTPTESNWEIRQLESIYFKWIQFNFDLPHKTLPLPHKTSRIRNSHPHVHFPSNSSCFSKCTNSSLTPPWYLPLLQCSRSPYYYCSYSSIIAVPSILQYISSTPLLPHALRVHLLHVW